MSDEKDLNKLSKELIIEVSRMAAESFVGVSVKDIHISNSGVQTQINTYISVKFGISIPEIAWDIQNKIRQAVYEATNSFPDKINVYIEGVHL